MLPLSKYKVLNTLLTKFNLTYNTLQFTLYTLNFIIYVLN